MSFIEVAESAESLLKILQPKNSTTCQLDDQSCENRSSFENMIQPTKKSE